MSDRARRTARTRRIVVGLLLVVGLGAIVLSLRGPGSPAATAAGPALATPVWSVRRVPQPVVAAVGRQRLQSGLASATGGVDACYSVDDSGTRVADLDATRPLIPASTQKLLTAAAALATLGPDFRYETKAVAPGGVDGGTVARLFLVGAGDPTIATPEAIAALAADPLTKGDVATPLADLADGLVRAGIRRIPGGIVGDDRRYDDTRYLPQWPASYRADSEIGPVGALTVDKGFTGDAGQGPAATDPALNAAQQLTRLLEARGVEVGAATRGRAPDGAKTVATLRSAPLTEVLTAFLASSDNLSGELLARELAVAAGKPGTTADGTAAILATLRTLGLPTEGAVMVDGSGLARENRATCSLLLATLGLASDPRFATLRDGLAIAGERGTLATRLRGTPLAGRLRAKTGSLTGVSGLAGFVDVKRPLEFALLANGSFGESSGVSLRERVAQLIAGYPDAPPPEELVPVPLTPVASTNEACSSSPAAC